MNAQYIAELWKDIELRHPFKLFTNGQIARITVNEMSNETIPGLGALKKNDPFDLIRALAGEAVITRSGDAVTSLTYFPECRDNYRVVGVVAGSLCNWNEKGRSVCYQIEMPSDLFMAPKERQVWVNVYRDSNFTSGVRLSKAFNSHDEATKNNSEPGYLKTVHVYTFYE